MAYNEEMAMGEGEGTEESSDNPMQEIEKLKQQVQALAMKLEELAGGTEEQPEQAQEGNAKAQKLMEMKRMQQMRNK